MPAETTMVATTKATKTQSNSQYFPDECMDIIFLKNSFAVKVYYATRKAGGPNPLVTPPSIAEADEKEFDLFERSEFSISRLLREAQSIPPKAGQEAGVPFLLIRFL